MDPTDSWLLLGVAVCVVISAIASAADAALSNITRRRFNALVADGRRRAQAVVRLLDDPAHIRATTLTLNTVAIVGATTMTLLMVLPWSAWWQPVLSLVGLLLILLIVGEALPKAFAMAHPERTGTLLAPVLSVLGLLLSPISGVINLLVRPIIGQRSGNVLVSEEELKMLVNVGEDEGVIEHTERQMIEGILVFGDTLVREIMVPRVDIIALASTLTVAEALGTAMQAGHSRIPVYHDTVDNVIGILYVRDLLPLLRDGHLDHKIVDVLRLVYYVPETMKVDDLLRNLQTRKVHMALVVDEYGGTAGLATIEDVLEEIVGEIQDEYDHEEPTIIQVDATTWIVDARVSLDDLNDHTGLHLATEEVDSLGGLVYEQLGSIPQVGDTIEVGDVTITVQSVQGLRPAKLEIVQRQPEPVVEGVGESQDEH